MRSKRPCHRLDGFLRNRLYVDELYGVTVIAFYYWWANVADWIDREVWGDMVATVTWLFKGWAQLQSLLRRQDGRRRLRQRLRRDLQRRRPSCAHTDRPRSDISSPSRGSSCRSGCHPDLERTPMNSLPILTLLTVLPVIGAAIALFSGRHSRGSRSVTGILCLLLSLVIWMHLPTDGSIGLLELHQWVPSLGIQYHLGVDGLGALMLVLSAIVSLMSIDAAHRVRHEPGLFFALVLLLESGLFGTFTALNFFHWFIFWELSLIPAFFLIKLWGGAKRGPAATQFFVYTMVGTVALLLSFLAIYQATGSMDFIDLAAMAATGTRAKGVGESRPGNDVARRRRARRLRGQSAADAVPHLAAGCVQRSAIAGHHAADRHHVEDGRLRPAAHRAAHVRSRDRRDPHAAAGARGHHCRDGRMGRSCAERPETRLRLLVGQSPRLLPARHLRDRRSYGRQCLRFRSQAAALNGVILQMFNHGLTAAALFWFISMIQERSAGLRGIDNFGGLRKPAPVFAGLMGIALFSSLGLPGLNGFVGEFLIFRGVFPLSWVAASISVLGLLVTAVVILTVIQKVFTGPVPERWAEFPDLHGGERLGMAPVIGLMFLIGLVPQIVIDRVNPTVQYLLAHWRF